MNKPDKTFRDKLLELNKPNQSYKDKYEKEIQKMLEKKLNYFWRIGFSIFSILGMLVTITFLKLAFSKMGHKDLGMFVRTITVSGAVLALAWMSLTAWIAITGKLNLRNQPARMAAIGIALGFFLMLYLMLVFLFPVVLNEPTGHSIIGIYISLIGFFLVVTISLCLIISALYRVGFRTREKLLEIEYRLADLTDKLEAKQLQ
jgi:hypothetical protein